LLASGVVLTLLIATTASLSVPLYAGIKGLWAGALAGAVVAPATAIGLTIGATQPVQA
jgi:hypothetical protein